MRNPAPISAATMPASEVLPSPGGPAKRMWSTGWRRWRAAWSTIPRCSTSWGCPRNSASARGRSPTSSSSSAPFDAAGSTTRWSAMPPAIESSVAAVRIHGQDLPARAGSPAHRLASSRSARRSISSTPTSSRRPSSAPRISSGAYPSSLSAARASAREVRLPRNPGSPVRARSRPGPARTDAAPSGERQVGQIEPALQFDEQAGRRLAPDPRHRAQGVEILLEHRSRQRRRRQRRHDRRAPAPGRPRASPAAPRSSAARRRARSRRGRWRPRARGCARSSVASDPLPARTSAAAVAGVTATRYPTPPTSTITSPSPVRTTIAPRSSPITLFPPSRAYAASMARRNGTVVR